MFSWSDRYNLTKINHYTVFSHKWLRCTFNGDLYLFLNRLHYSIFKSASLFKIFTIWYNLTFLTRWILIIVHIFIFCTLRLTRFHRWTGREWACGCRGPATRTVCTTPHAARPHAVKTSCSMPWCGVTSSPWERRSSCSQAKRPPGSGPTRAWTHLYGWVHQHQASVSWNILSSIL